MIKPLLFVSAATVQASLTFLHSAGERESEGVVLWLGHRGADGIIVTEAYVPDQKAAGDYFRILPHAMAELLSYLGQHGVFIAAQVHSHPFEAFHSAADNTWAIIRHLGALSLVVPHFGLHTSVDNFLDQIALFELSAANVWQEVNARGRQNAIRIV